MSSSQQFTDVLREWAEVFQHRSMRDFMQFTRNSGLSMPQLSTLFRLYHEDHCGVTGIGDHLGVSNAAASQMVERLVQQGLLERTEGPQDRRMKQITLSPKGRALVQESIEARRRWIEQLTTALTAEEQDAIVAALTLLTRAARKLDRISQA
jgi:DNA-binding MarR family transcriptional regulator